MEYLLLLRTPSPSPIPEPQRGTEACGVLEEWKTRGAMDVDDWLLRKLFGADAEKKVTDAEVVGLVGELGSCSVGKLVSEPARLGEEKLGLEEETEALAFHNYNTFIQAANASREIYDSFTLINERLERVVGELPELSAQAKDFLAEAGKISQRRAENTLALNKHSQLLQVLEVPQVMDTCVRAGYWEEALEVIRYVGKLERRIGHIPIVATVAAEVTAQRSALVRQLLEQLHLPLSLPQCLKVVGFLRRLGVFTEPELRLKFLMARSAWLRSTLASVPATEPYEHVTRVMEQSRVHLFDIVTQYKAVFTEDEGPTAGLGLGLGGAKAQRAQLPTSLPALFYAWLGREVDLFLAVLEADLAKGVGGRLDAVAAQVSYFGQSLGRVGADFRLHALPLLEKAAFAEFAGPVDPAARQLLLDIRSPGFLATVGDSGGMPSLIGGPGSGASLAPPTSLMDVAALAHFTNAVLNGLNNLRGFAPLTIAHRVASTIQTALVCGGKEVGLLKASPGDKAKVERVATLLADVLAPFLARCVAAVFPPQALFRILRQTKVNGELRSGVGRLSVEAVREVVAPLLPPLPVLLPSPVPAAAPEDVPLPQATPEEVPTAGTENAPAPASPPTEAPATDERTQAEAATPTPQESKPSEAVDVSAEEPSPTQEAADTIDHSIDLDAEDDL